MKRALAILTLGGALCAFASDGPQTAGTTAEDQQIAVTIRELREQQAQVAENQAKIDAKLASVAEAIRQARIFASRGGKR